MRTTDAVETFLIAKTSKGLSPSTLDMYRYRLHIFARLNPDLLLGSARIEHFLARVGPTQETREAYYRLLRNFYGWLAHRRLIRKNQNPLPRIETPLLRRRVARSLNIEQLGLLLTFPGHPEQVRAFLYLLADTGLRLSEAQAIHDLTNRGLDSVITSGKTGEREVPISPKVAAMVVDTSDNKVYVYDADGTHAG